MVQKLVFDILDKSCIVGEKFLSSVDVQAKFDDFKLRSICKPESVEFEANFDSQFVLGKKYKHGVYVPQERIEITVPISLECKFEIKQALENFSILLDFWEDPCCLALVHKSPGIEWHNTAKWTKINTWTQNDVMIEHCPVCKKRLPNIENRWIGYNRFRTIIKD